MKWIKLPVLCLFSTMVIAQAPEFEGKGLLYLQDGDFTGESRFTHLVSKTGADMLGMFSFPLRTKPSRQPSEQSISNSAIDNHRPIAVRADAGIAYILETRGSLPKGTRDAALGELPSGSYVSVVRIGDHLKPDYRFPVAENPTSISLGPSNKYLAVSSNNLGNEIQVFELDDLGKPVRLLPHVLHLEGGPIQDLIWHPSQEYLIFIRREEKEVGLIRVVRDRNLIIRMEQVGETIKFEGKPASGAFSHDGKNLFVLDQGDVDNGIPGKVFQVRLSMEEEMRHVLLARTEVGFRPSHLQMHPNAPYLAVSNAGRDEGEPGTVSLLGFQNGNLEAKAQVVLDGFVPSGVAFDKSGDHFAVACLQANDYGKPAGAISFYRFSNAKVERQPARILVPTGVHFLFALQ